MSGGSQAICEKWPGVARSASSERRIVGAPRGFRGSWTGHPEDMDTVLIVAAVVAFWCLAPFPLAVAVGRSLRAGSVDAQFEEIVRDYEAAGA